jgi:hypothetical protein
VTQEHPGSEPTEDPGQHVYQQMIHAEPGGTVYAVLDGDMHIRNGYPVYRFESFSLSLRSADAARTLQQRGTLTAARSRTALTSQSGELATLASWRDDPAPGVSVLLLHGPGDQGQSGLNAQFALDSVDQGWLVWAAHHVCDPTAQTSVTPGDPGLALLTIVECAERWPADDLQLLLQNPLLRRPRRARVLLIAQSAESWWPALRHRFGKAGITVGGTLALRPPPQGAPSFIAEPLSASSARSAARSKCLHRCDAGRLAPSAATASRPQLAHAGGAVR